MILNIYSIYDNAAKAFVTPFFMHNNGLAIRAFQDNVNAADTNLAQHPEQFTLYCIGEFDDETAELTSVDPADNLGNGMSYRKPDEEKLALAELGKRMDRLYQAIQQNGENEKHEQFLEKIV